MGRLGATLAASISRRSRVVLLAAALMSLAALVPAARLRVDADLTRLLPRDAPAARDYALFLRTFGGFEKVYILVRAPRPLGGDLGPLIAAAEELAAELRRSPLVAEARSGLTPEDEQFFFQFVAPRLPLLVDDRTFAQLPQRLRPEAIGRRVQWMRQTLSSPAGSAAAPFFTSDPLGVGEGLLAATSGLLPVDPFTGAFVSRRGEATLVILSPSRPEIDPAGGRALAAALATAYAQVRKQSSVPLEFAAIGGPLYAAHDEALLRTDLSRTASSTLLGVAIVLLVGFEGVLLPFAILLAVLLGVVWTAGLAGAALGTVTVVGVGFTAALLGMGVDYGIHGGVRFRQLRGAGVPAAAALAGVFQANGPGVLAAAFATAGGLSTLLLAHFRPLFEAGLVLAAGVLTTLLATATASAAIAVDPAVARRPPPPPRRWTRYGLPLVRAVVAIGRRHPRVVVAATLLVSAGAGWGLSRLAVTTDLRALRPADAPAARAERQLVESFSLGLDTFSVVARGRSLEAALDRAAAVRALLGERLGAAAEITSPSDLLTAGDRLARRLAALRSLPLGPAADSLERELKAAGFKREPFAPALAALRALARGSDPGAPPRSAWPRWMAELVRETPDGQVAVAVHVRLPDAGAARGPEALARELARRDPTLALASVSRVGSELKTLALRDLSRSSTLALLLIAAIVLISFRGALRETLLSFVPLGCGALWTFGAWGAAGRSIDLLGIFTVPLLLSTGIILGVHAVHWRRLHAEAGFAGTFEEVGLAMLLATLTTAVGFGSLVASRVPGLRNAGILVAAGICSCLLAAFLVLPAVEALGLAGGGPPQPHSRQEEKQ
jgi:predicted RND superfamily exporter protein